ncbi:hypothetical protein [Pelagovum pacificum]|nr:hypothetical protein [Pelagovum pacificum]QQA43940.1 hypothetical protein I8N54_05010 [Pelagovum pacificum]
MAQRHEAHDSLDFFPTPPWATRALCEWLQGQGQPIDQLRATEPACGQGDMARPLAEYFGDVWASDVHDHGWTGLCEIWDFLLSPPHRDADDWIITNPPFRLALPFIQLARMRAAAGVAMLVRTSFLEGGERYRELFADDRPTHVLQFCERVPMAKGRLDAKGSTATAYCWLVWLGADRALETVFDWIPPGTRKRLELPGDYPTAPKLEPGSAPLLEGART